MVKAVLISIRPEWVDKILSEKKAMEIRKTRPKLETPFRCYIYETQGRTETPWIDEDGHTIFKGRGQVIGEFVCDKIDNIWKRGIPENFDYCYLPLNEWGNDDIETEIRDIRESCIPKEKLNAYAGKTPVLYAWHISGLKIYDKPKELNEFWFPPELYCEKERCGGCPYDQVADVNGEYSFDCEWKRPLTRPPQNWCYVEELK